MGKEQTKKIRWCQRVLELFLTIFCNNFKSRSFLLLDAYIFLSTLINHFLDFDRTKPHSQ